MHPDDRSKFAYLLLRLNTAFDKKVSQVKSDMYWEQLMDIPIELVGQSVERWIREGRHYPKVAELRLMCDVIISASANRKRIAGPMRWDDYKGEPVYHCLVCEDIGWRWHDSDGGIITPAKACEINARRVTACTCRATNPAYRARNPETDRRYGTNDSYRSKW